MNRIFFALLLTVVLTLTASCTLAATDITIDTGLPQFDIHFAATEDVTVESMAGDGYCLITFGDIDTGNPNKMIYMATITISEETGMDGKNLSDLTDEQIKQLFDQVVLADEGGENPFAYEVIDMDDGVRALSIVNGVTREEAWVFTIRDGVLVQMFGFTMNSTPVTDEDIKNTITLMDKLEFVPKSETSLKVEQ